MKKIKVCHICNLGMNGKAIFVCNLLEKTDFGKYDVTIVNYWAVYAEPIMSRLEKLPVRIVNPPKGNEIAFCRFLNRFFKTNKFDVCHSHMWDLSGLFLAVAHHRGIPVRVAHSHNTKKIEGRYNRLKEFARDKVIWGILLRMIRLHANRYIACSEEAARWLFVPSIIQSKKYHIVPNGIDLQRFRPMNRSKNIHTEILFVGRFDPQKNPVFAIQAFLAYLKLNPDAHMTMIGKGKLRNEVNQEIIRLGLREHIAIIPETDDMENYYNSADVFLFPSLYEGLGIVLIEAQASGLKCLSSDMVPMDTQCGLVVYKSLEDGAAAWGGYIKELLENDRLSLDRASLNRFDSTNTARIIDELYGL